MEEKQNQEQTEVVEEVTVQEASETTEVAESEGQVVEAVEEKAAVPTEEVVTEPKKRAKKVKNEKPQESYEGLTDDEIYTKMQTEKLVQKRKKRKIITAVSMGIAFALALVIIIMAAVPVSLKPRCIDNDYTQVRLYKGTNIENPVATVFKEDERFDKFKKVFDKSFARSYLSALFSGSLFAYEIQENHDLFSVATKDLTNSNSSYFVKLTYNKAHKVTKQSGKVYYSDRYANRDWSFTFTEAYIKVNTESGFRDTKVYIPVSYPDSKEGEYAIVITVKANTSKIYDAWSDFVAD